MTTREQARKIDQLEAMKASAKRHIEGLRKMLEIAKEYGMEWELEELPRTIAEYKGEVLSIDAEIEDVSR